MAIHRRFYLVASVVALVAALLLRGMTIAAGALSGGFIVHAIADDIIWWENDGSEHFTEHVVDDNFDVAQSVYPTDLDDDDDVDVLGAAQWANDITWWEQVPNSPPTLHWTGETNYLSDGLHPESGDASDDYVYRIKYADADGDPPAYVRVHIEKGGADIGGSPFTLNCASGDYTTGVICTYTKAGLAAGGDYTYHFVAQDDQGDPATPTTVLDGPDVTCRLYLPAVMKGFAPPPLPSVPVLDGISNPDGDGDYTVSWSAVSDATSYTLQEDDDTAFPSPTPVYSGPDTSTSVTGRAVGTYHYRVRASNASGSSDWSNVESVAVPGPPPPAAPVLDNISNPDGDGSYTVSWSTVSGATSYTLQEDDNAAFPDPTPVYSGPDTSTSIAGRDVGTYYYRVKASNAFGSSDWSDVKSVVVTVTPPYDWTHLSTGITETLEAVYFVDSQNGWVAGTVGAIFHTADGGQSWQRQDSGTTDSLSGMFFLDLNRGWVVGGKGLILRTTNGGDTWETQTSPADTYLEAINFADENHGYIAGCHFTVSGWPYRFTAHGYVLRSTDGGDSWSLASRTGISSRCVVDLHFVDAYHGWLATYYTGSFPYPNYPRVYMTSDGGDNWTNQSVPVSEGELRAVAFVDTETGWIVGSSGLVLHTANGGDLWSEQDSGVTSRLDAVDFVSSTTGWVVEPILHTTDGGETWASQSVDPACTGLRDLHFVDIDHGWVVGNNGVVCKSH